MGKNTIKIEKGHGFWALATKLLSLESIFGAFCALHKAVLK